MLVNSENQCSITVNVETEQESLLCEVFNTLLKEYKLGEPIL